jgi:hypothetical protein
MNPPTMCTGTGDQPPRLPAQLARHLAVAELLAFRVEHATALAILAQENGETLDVKTVHFALSHLATLAMRLRQQMQMALKEFDHQLADIDLLTINPGEQPRRMIRS